MDSIRALGVLETRPIGNEDLEHLHIQLNFLGGLTAIHIDWLNLVQKITMNS